MILSDPSAERAILAGICRYGEEIYLDISDIIKESSFTIDSNAIIYRCIKNIYEKNNQLTVDISSIYSSANELGLSTILSKKEETQHLKAIIDFPVSKENIRKFAGKIKKLEIARSLHKELGIAQEKMLDINGTESIGSIISLAEDTIFGFTNNLNEVENNPILMGKDLEEYIEYLSTNPIDQVGIPTGFPIYDQAIGGGLRKSTVNIIAARPKTGKTLLSDNMGYYIANKLKIPVLNMDTEMTKEDHIHRVLAMITEIEIRDIETGKFISTEDKSKKIDKAVQELKNSPLYYKSIAGKAFDEQIAIMRRWLLKDVGLNEDGTAKDCVIFYDYLKLMDTQGMSQDLKEYQVLGFMMTELHNFATKYKVPVVAFIQLNRDGINKLNNIR